MLSATTPPPRPSSAQSTQRSLPPPQIFDIIPPLHTLLSRLLTNPLNNNNTLPTLSSKDLVSEVAAIKIKIHQARVAVEVLPDVDRTVDEQIEEIKELEERIRGLKQLGRDITEAAKRGRYEGTIS